MRAHSILRVPVLLGAAGVIVLASCGSKTITSTPDATVTETAAVTTSATSAATTTAATSRATAPATTASTAAPTTTLAPTTTTTLPAAIGSTITLAGRDSKLAVTLAEYRDPVESTGFSKPDDGKHYVGVKLRVLNTGITVWSDSLSNGAKLVDDKRQEYRPTIASSTGLADFGSSTVGPNDTRLGWILFEVPDGTVVARFTLALDSGFANQIGQWLLGSGEPIDPAPAVTLPEAGVGATISLSGRENEVNVTVLAVADPAEPENRFSAPDPGMRLVAVQFEFANTGAVVYDDSPTNGITLIDALGQSWRSSIGDVSAGPSFSGGLTIAQNDSRVGWVAFEIPADAQIAKVQVALDSGFADETGEWRLALA